MGGAVLNDALIAVKAGDITVYNYDNGHRNISQHQPNILLSVSVSRHVLV